jgi:hypothetical protein
VPRGGAGARAGSDEDDLRALGQLHEGADVDHVDDLVEQVLLLEAHHVDRQLAGPQLSARVGQELEELGDLRDVEVGDLLLEHLGGHPGHARQLAAVRIEVEDMTQNGWQYVDIACESQGEGQWSVADEGDVSGTYATCDTTLVSDDRTTQYGDAFEWVVHHGEVVAVRSNRSTTYGTHRGATTSCARRQPATERTAAPGNGPTRAPDSCDGRGGVRHGR